MYLNASRGQHIKFGTIPHAELSTNTFTQQHLLNMSLNNLLSLSTTIKTKSHY